METVEEVQSTTAEPRVDESVRIQQGSYLLELSLDWIVLRASENVHHLLRESHVTLIDEPLGRFVHAQALHELRNLFSRLSGTTGIARVYAVRLTDEHDLVDVAFQLIDGRVLLEIVPSTGCFGECFGTVAGLIDGLSNAQGQALLDGGARRMRALTGYDRVTLRCGDGRVESSRGAFGGPSSMTDDLPVIVCDRDDRAVAIFPRAVEDSSAAEALLRSCNDDQRAALQRENVRSSLRIPFCVDSVSGEFRCESRSPRGPSFEVHAAAELFAQLFAMRLEIDGLKSH